MFMPIIGGTVYFVRPEYPTVIHTATITQRPGKDDSSYAVRLPTGHVYRAKPEQLAYTQADAEALSQRLKLDRAERLEREVARLRGVAA